VLSGLRFEALENVAPHEVGQTLALAFDDPVSDWVELIQRERDDGRLCLQSSVAAWADSQLVGICLANAPVSACGRVGATGVLPGWRRQGVGKRLVGDVLQRLEGAGAVEMSLEVSADNTEARRLYRRLGFREERGLRILSSRRSSLLAVSGTVTARPITRDEALSALPSLHVERPAFQRTTAYISTFHEGVVAHGVDGTQGLVGVVLQRGRDLLDVAAHPADLHCVSALIWAASELSWVQRLIHVVEEDPVGDVLEQIGFEVDSRAFEMRRTVL